MRFLILALTGLLTFAVPALAQEAETESPEQRYYNEAHAEHAEAVAEWRAATDAYIAALTPTELPVAVATPVAVPVPVPEEAAERFGFGIDYANDGSCTTNPLIATGSYDRESASVDIHGSVRVAPSGGDCTRHATSYAFMAERRFGLAAGWEVVGKIGADGRSLHAVFDVLDAPLRPDGAYQATSLPVGFVRTETLALGVSTPKWYGARITAAYNAPPTDWAKTDPSPTAHFAVDYDFGDRFDLHADVDIRDAERHYGNARASYRPSIAAGLGTEITAGFAWGLDQLAGVGSPANPFGYVLGEPDVRSWAYTVGIGITF